MFGGDTSASSQSYIGLGGDSSQFPRTEEGGGPRGKELDDELMFDIDADLEADDRAGPGPGALRCHNYRSRFPPCLFGVEAYTREIDDSINNTHLQHGLKKHPST